MDAYDRISLVMSELGIKICAHKEGSNNKVYKDCLDHMFSGAFNAFSRFCMETVKTAMTDAGVACRVYLKNCRGSKTGTKY